MTTSFVDAVCVEDCPTRASRYVPGRGTMDDDTRTVPDTDPPVLAVSDAPVDRPFTVTSTRSHGAYPPPRTTTPRDVAADRVVVAALAVAVGFGVKRSVSFPSVMRVRVEFRPANF